MSTKNQWPFSATTLSDILDSETLSVLVAGCRERMGRDLIIICTLDGEPVQRIDAFRPKQYYQFFCKHLRDEDRVTGADEACSQCDLTMARAQGRKTDPQEPHCYDCHMGLQDYACGIVVHGKLVGALIAGQFRPSDAQSFDGIRLNIDKLKMGQYPTMQVRDNSVVAQLRSDANKLEIAPANFREKIRREAEYITAIASAAYEHKKATWEQAFLDNLRDSATNTTETLAEIRTVTTNLLTLVQGFCQCRYAVFFANTRENETVLTPIAQVGETHTTDGQLPHFNWRKGGLPLAQSDLKNWNIASDREAAMRGIRGGKAENFNEVACILPASLGELYRGVLICGPFSEPVDLENQRRFLTEITRVISRHILTELQKLSLQQQQRQWKSTAQLITHQVRTTMMAILTQVGTAQMIVEQGGSVSHAKLIEDSLKSAQAAGLKLGKATAETLNSHVLHLERDDFEFETYPLSVLVANCAAGYTEVAGSKGRKMIVDSSVEMLPTASVDISRLTIALSNIIDNAIKYSFPNTTIYVRRGTPEGYAGNPNSAYIEIEDLGHEIPEEEKRRVFEQGRRGLVGATASMIGGSGLGLWEAQAVVQAHGGTVSFSSLPTSRHYYHNNRGHVVSFMIEIPVRQEERA